MWDGAWSAWLMGIFVSFVLVAEGVDGMWRKGVSLCCRCLFIDGRMHNSSYVYGVSI